MYFVVRAMCGVRVVRSVADVWCVVFVICVFYMVWVMCDVRGLRRVWSVVRGVFGV